MNCLYLSLISMRICHKIPLLLQLYTFDVNMPEEGLYELTIIHKNTGVMTSFQGNTWGKVIHQAFVHMNKTLKQQTNKIG